MKTEELYFMSENDAEAARAELVSYRVKNVSIEELPATGRTGMVDNHVDNALDPGTYGPPGLSDKDFENERGKGDGEGTATHLLRFSIDEKDYDNAMKALDKRGDYRKTP